MDTTSHAFERLHEKVRRWIWEQNWTELRDVQEEAVDPILSGTTDVIIMAATAGGKTEAAFLPICSRLVGHSGESIRALYVGPLKALINDQFGRVEQLCKNLGIPVHRWHGDVAASAKQSLLKQPAGILLITPESLEALFVVHGPRIRDLFAQLEHVVIDELHAFIGNERGRQLQSLLHRLEVATRRQVPRIALSATLGDKSLAAEFLRPGCGQAVRVIESQEGGRELKLLLRGYRRVAPMLSGESQSAAQGTGREVEPEDRVSGDRAAIAEDLFGRLRGSDNLIFANTRTQVEEFADLLRRMGEQRRVPNEFFPHHGNLSKELREDVERILKDKSQPLSAVCTSTLELGIDIGSVHSIAQIGVPPSVAAMRQRLGRSGRRAGEASVLRMYVIEPEVTDKTAPPDTLHPELVQSVAMVHLLVASWYEPPASGALHLSTLIQQVLSMIAERGGVTAKVAWDVLCESGPFTGLDVRMFAALLRGLGTSDLLTQAGDGTLLLGGAGERIVNHFSFYTAFTTPEEYRLITGGHTLGTLPINYPIAAGDFLIFAGKRWRVLSVDLDHKVIDLVPAPGGRVPLFAGTGASVHDRVRQEMLQTYLSGDLPRFLDSTARDLLTEGRMNFARLGLAEQRVIEDAHGSLLFPWMGDRVLNTILLQLRALQFKATFEGVAIGVEDCTANDLLESLKQLVANGPADGFALAAGAGDKIVEKYDRFIPEHLLALDYASRNLDPEGAWQTMREIVDSIPRIDRRSKSPAHPDHGTRLLPVLWSTREWVDAIVNLASRGTVAERAVLVPRERVAHALRRELVRIGRADLLIGTRFIRPVTAAQEVLISAGADFAKGEEALRPLRMRELFHRVPALHHFPLQLLRSTLGWDEAFAHAVFDLEGAGLRPDRLPTGRRPEWEDIAALWNAADGSAGNSWTSPRILHEAADLLRRDPRNWPFDGPVLAAIGAETTAVEANFLRAVPGVRLALLAARPLRDHYLERLEQLFGPEAAESALGSAPSRSAQTERDLLASYLFEQPALLADPARPRSTGPDGTVGLEEHGGIEREIEAAADWVARQVIEKRTPLEDIAVLVPAMDPTASLLVARLRRLPWSDGEFPVIVAGGLLATGTAAGARLLATVRALRSGLSAESLADVLPAIRTDDPENRHISRGAALDLAYSLGTVGGSASNLRKGLEWRERIAERRTELAIQLSRAQERSDDDGQLQVARSAPDLERLLRDLTLVQRGISALVDVLRAAVGGATLATMWPLLRNAFDNWLLLPGDGAQVLALLDGRLTGVIEDAYCGGVIGCDALTVIEDALRSLRLPAARFGEPAVYVGTIREAVGIPFHAVRIMGLSEGALPFAWHEDPVLDDLLRQSLSTAPVLTTADRALADLHAFDRVIRNTRGSIVLSASRVGIGHTEREPSSVFIEAAAALGRPNRITRERDSSIPSVAALRRDGFDPGRASIDQFRCGTPLSASAWLDRAATMRGALPVKWRQSGALDLERVCALTDPGTWTALDGIIGPQSVEPLIPGLSAERPISASRLRRLIQCPHRFLFENVIGWSEPSAPPSLREIDALAYGGLFHRILEKFCREHGHAFGERESALAEWFGLADQLIDSEFAEFCSEYPLVGDAVRRQQRDRLRRDVRAFLAHDWSSAPRRTFVAVERGFGTPTPLPLTLGDVTLYVRGFIDRIDIEDNVTLVRDLKTGRSHPRRGDEVAPDPLLDLQIALYGMVARALAADWSLPPTIAASYVYADAYGEPERSFRGDFETLEITARRWLTVTAQLLARRGFPRTPVAEDCTYCPFEAVCGRNPNDRAARLLAEVGGPFTEFGVVREKSQDAIDQ